MTEFQHKRVKIGLSSLNQTVYDDSVNVPNLMRAIDLAVADKADILATQELSLTGYAADDYHQWNKDNARVWKNLVGLACYANEKDPNLVLSVGAPWHYADKNLPANDPAYNIDNRPFNAHFIITGGKIVAISAKSILADGPAEYETRQFKDWPLFKGTILVKLPDGSRVPFGKPVVYLNDGGDAVTVVHEICAEGWPGIYGDLNVNLREQAEARLIAAMAKKNDLSIVINPSSSKPEPGKDKEKLRAALCKTGAEYCGAYVYINALGSDSGVYAAEGSQIVAQKVKDVARVVYHGERYSFKDVSYGSSVVEVPVARRGTSDALVEHVFSSQNAWNGANAEAKFDRAFAKHAIDEKELSYEEYLRSISLWLRDYLAKQNWAAQGYVVSLSGGKDSAYGAVAVSAMIDLEVRENGVEGFFARFRGLKYKDEVLEIYRKEGEAAALQAIKNNFLTCLYLPTENSSSETQEAARFLIEGDKSRAGIGGKFYVAPVQGMVDEAVIAFTGLDLDKVAKENIGSLLKKKYAGLSKDERQMLARAKLVQIIKAYVNAKPGKVTVLPDYITAACKNPLPTWANPADDLTLQNIQARVRLSVPWAVANEEGKIALATSNASEAVLGYTTAAGDMHMGGVNPIGGVPKDVITKTLRYLETKGLVGHKPVFALSKVNKGEPTAELRKTFDKTAKQTDEVDLGFTYEQSQFIEERLLVCRKTPVDVLADMQRSPIFPKNFDALRGILIKFANRWANAQFKRVMGPLSPHVGSNVDPHQSIRTPVLGDHFRTDCALMTLDVLSEIEGGPECFKKTYGMSLGDAKTAAALNKEFKQALITRYLDDLLSQESWSEFKALAKEVRDNVGGCFQSAAAETTARPLQFQAAERDLKFHFLASPTQAAGREYKKLIKRYGQTESLVDADVIIAVGGDGEMLRVIQQAICFKKPVFGLNLGHVGHFSNAYDKKADLKEIVQNAAAIELTPLHAKVTFDNGDIREAFAVNEVHVCNRNRAESIGLNIDINGKRRISNFRGDGMLVSTTPGSTGYNKSARGPILPVDDERIILTPNNPNDIGESSKVIMPSLVTLTSTDLARKINVIADTEYLGEDLMQAGVRAKSIEVFLDSDYSYKLLFDPRLPLSEKIMRIQFPNAEGENDPYLEKPTKRPSETRRKARHKGNAGCGLS